MRIFLSAGEPSGDLHASNFLRELRLIDPSVVAAGLGGEHLRSAGCELLFPLANFAVMGLGPVLAHLPTFLNVLSLTDRWLARHRPDAVVLIDNPGLNWWVARRARARGIPTFYFVPPQLWAWATWRVRKMRRWIDHVLCTLPFEEPWYRERGVQAHFVGHPYFDAVRRQRLDQSFLAAERARPGRIVALLPGSRTHEVERNFPTMVRAARLLHRQHPDVRFLVAGYRARHLDLLRHCLHGADLPLDLHVGRTPEIIHLSHSCLAVSGSVSLELLHYAKPSVIVYRTGLFGQWFYQRFVEAKFITLVNLLADKELMPELVSRQCSAEAAADHLSRWLADPFKHLSAREDLRRLRDRVAQPGACARAAAFVHERLAGTPSARRRASA
jgi:lipid-A-disaccharide synthase